ncbi:MAG: hypothetical protein JKY54_05285 [Flavobacteriales bacterium]|nr:hypothetical protein [Flavobacteriales bacterium]
MKNPKFYLLLIAFSCIVFSCSRSSDEMRDRDLQSKMKVLKLELSKERLENQILKDQVTELKSINTEELQETLTPEQLAVKEEEEGWAKYTGEHLFTLQWIGWEQPGKCTFELDTEGVFSVTGEQKNNNGDFLTIDGTLTMNGNDHLVFNGIITSKVDHLYDGETCTREGEYNFKVTAGRKYWRLQEMENCEGNNVVDYIDIFFK